MKNCSSQHLTLSAETRRKCVGQTTVRLPITTFSRNTKLKQVKLSRIKVKGNKNGARPSYGVCGDWRSKFEIVRDDKKNCK